MNPPTNFSHALDRLAHRHFDGAATSGDRLELERLILADPAAADRFAELCRLEAALERTVTGQQKLRNAVHELSAHEFRAARRAKVRRVFFRTAGAAAAVLVAGTCVKLLWPRHGAEMAGPERKPVPKIGEGAGALAAKSPHKEKQASIAPLLAGYFLPHLHIAAGATLGEALGQVQSELNELNRTGIAAISNLTLNAPPEVAQRSIAGLKLRGVPALAVLRVLAAQADCAMESQGASVDFKPLTNLRPEQEKGNPLRLEVTPAFLAAADERLDEIRRHFRMGLGYYDLGQFNEAREQFAQVLEIDPANTAAKRSLERTEREIDDYLVSARDHTRQKMLRDVDQLWEAAVPSGVESQPSVDFGTDVSYMLQDFDPPQIPQSWHGDAAVAMSWGFNGRELTQDLALLNWQERAVPMFDVPVEDGYTNGIEFGEATEKFLLAYAPSGMEGFVNLGAPIQGGNDAGTATMPQMDFILLDRGDSLSTHFVPATPAERTEADYRQLLANWGIEVASFEGFAPPALPSTFGMGAGMNTLTPQIVTPPVSISFTPTARGRRVLAAATSAAEQSAPRRTVVQSVTVLSSPQVLLGNAVPLQETEHVFSGRQFQEWLDASKDAAGADVLAAPSMATRADGQAGSLEAAGLTITSKARLEGALVKLEGTFRLQPQNAEMVEQDFTIFLHPGQTAVLGVSGGSGAGGRDYHVCIRADLGGQEP